MWTKKKVKPEDLEAAAQDLLDAAYMHIAWIDSENRGPDYGTLSRDTHPHGEELWHTWWQGQLTLCAETEGLCRAGIAKAEGK